jgi:hypothetical protein
LCCPISFTVPWLIPSILLILLRQRRWKSDENWCILFHRSRMLVGHQKWRWWPFRDGFYRLSVPRSPEGRCRLTILVLDSTWLGRFWLSLGTSLKNIFFLGMCLTENTHIHQAVRSSLPNMLRFVRLNRSCWNARWGWLLGCFLEISHSHRIVALWG